MKKIRYFFCGSTNAHQSSATCKNLFSLSRQSLINHFLFLRNRFSSNLICNEESICLMFLINITSIIFLHYNQPISRLTNSKNNISLCAPLGARVPYSSAYISSYNIQIYWHLRAGCRWVYRETPSLYDSSRSLRVISCMIARSASDFQRARPLVSRDMQHKSCFRFQFITRTERPRTKSTMIYTSLPYSHRKFIA